MDNYDTSVNMFTEEEEYKVIDPIIPQEGDEYDRFGRNYSAIMRLQEQVPWTLVIHKKR